MKAMILAAGEGTRLRPLTSNTPKPLLLVAGKPFLTHVLEALKEAGISEVAILVGWKANRIKEFYGDGSGLGMNIRRCGPLRREHHRRAVHLPERRRGRLGRRPECDARPP